MVLIWYVSFVVWVLELDADMSAHSEVTQWEV